ncbi:branched-chain-amino-acid aminotransferase, cytosolic-like isoform X2 [Arapaima gigas]
MADLQSALKENRVMEQFGNGTACVVRPIGRIMYQGQFGILGLAPLHCSEDGTCGACRQPAGEGQRLGDACATPYKSSIRQVLMGAVISAFVGFEAQLLPGEASFA